jgi:hypothetical protein
MLIGPGIDPDTVAAIGQAMAVDIAPAEEAIARAAGDTTAADIVVVEVIEGAAAVIAERIRANGAQAGSDPDRTFPCAIRTCRFPVSGFVLASSAAHSQARERLPERASERTPFS